MRKILVSVLIGGVSLMAMGCNLAPDYARPQMDVGKTWQGDATIAETVDAQWWKQFNSAELDDLITRAVAANTDVLAAIQRIEQARAQAQIAGAALYPKVDADASVGLNDGRNVSGDASWRGGLAVSYELDLWQRNSNNRQAARANLQAAAFDRDALALVVTSETVRRYVEILTFRERMRLTTESIGLFKDTLKIIEARHREGASSGLEVAQQKATLANAEASLANLRQQSAVAQNALAILLGQAPQDFAPEVKTVLTDLTVPNVAPVLPASLMERRPDIRSAEEKLKAANANIGVARAELFPSMTLGASAALAANPASAPVNWTAGTLASVAQRIFAGGALRGQVALAKARQQELVETYRGAVLAAFGETQDALVTVTETANRESLLREALTESQKAYGIAKDRYDSGAADFLSLLDAQRSLLQAQENDVMARLERLNAATSLYKALGGGWR